MSFDDDLSGEDASRRSVLWLCEKRELGRGGARPQCQPDGRRVADGHGEPVCSSRIRLPLAPPASGSSQRPDWRSGLRVVGEDAESSALARPAARGLVILTATTCGTDVSGRHPRSRIGAGSCSGVGFGLASAGVGNAAAATVQKTGSARRAGRGRTSPSARGGAVQRSIEGGAIGAPVVGAGKAPPSRAGCVRRGRHAGPGASLRERRGVIRCYACASIRAGQRMFPYRHGSA